MNIKSCLRISCVMVVALICFACDQKPKNPVSEYGDTLINAYKTAGQAGEAANLDAVRKTVNIYHSTHDKYPQSLDEVKALMTTPVDLSRYDYDPETGSVSLKK